MMTLSAYFLKMAEILPSNCKIEATVLDEGFSNKVYLIHWGGTARFVLRIPYIDCNAFCINRVEEIQILRDAADSNLSPAVVWNDDNGAFTCEFVHQPSLDWNVHHKDQDIKRIASTLVKAHGLPKSQQRYSVFDVVKHYLTGIESHIFDNKVLADEYKYLITAFGSLAPPKQLLPLVLCHNDLNPKNILMDDDMLWLIDWEYSGVGDPLFDLAVVVKSHNLDARQTALLLSAYRPGFDSEEWMLAINEYVKLYSLREMTWLLLKHLITPDDNVSLEYYYEFKATPNLNPFFL